MPHWLLTNTCYGNWLPGDPRGSVTSVRDLLPDDAPTESRIVHNRVGDPVEIHNPSLYRSAQSKLKCPPIQLTTEHAAIVLAQFQETCQFRGWQLEAVAIMFNHFHLVVGMENTPGSKALSDLKAYASRSLNKRFGKPLSETWWTMGGSTRPLLDEAAIIAAIRYVFEKQPHPLVVWRAPSADASGSC